MKSIQRRHFLGTLAAAACVAATPARRAASAVHETVRVAVIGTGVRGKYLIGNLPESARVTAICDCATSRMADTLKPHGVFATVLQRFRDADAPRCATYQDYRRLLDREQLDAVIIATPDHHHTLAAMLALQAGLDVYLEKPLTVGIREGRLLCELVRKTGKVLQVGSQQRTMEMNRFACDFVRSGGLGKISKVELPAYPGPLPVPPLEAEAPVGGIDFDLFCGPAALRPHHRNVWMKEDFKVGELLWRGWDLFRDYSGHLMTNWGAHSVDMVQLALGRDDTGPTQVQAVQPRAVDELWPAWKQKTPRPAGDTTDRRFWPVVMKYDDGVELHFAHGAEFIVFHGARGTLKMRRNVFAVDPPELVSQLPDPAVAEKWKGSGHVARPHLENWLDCIRTRRVPHAPVEAGHRTATVCHLANLARELNRPLKWDSRQERFIGDDAANELLDRPRRQGFELPK